MKEIFFDYHNTPVTIPDEIYNKIVSIVDIAKICAQCAEGYTDENPCVALNTCLTCLLKKDKYKGLTFIGERRIESKYKSFRFINEEGKIFTSSVSSDMVHERITETLNHWGFSYPLSYFCDGEEYRLYDTNWIIYGDIKVNTVLLLRSSFTYWRNSQNNIKYVTHFLFKNGGYIEVNKRKKEVKQLFNKARELLTSAEREAMNSEYLIYRMIPDVASKEGFTG